MNKSSAIIIIFVFTSYFLYGQIDDTSKSERFSFYGQATVIWQYQPPFYAKYSGTNSLTNREDNQTTVTSTLFAGVRLWKGGSFFINPELAGGSGLSGALGVAASTNGESYRVGNPAPRINAARIFYSQLFNLDGKEEYQSSDENQLAGKTPKNYFGIIIGKISMADYFDNNKYSHDPRTQFMSWGLMSDGAWDYPANTIGYTPSLILEWVKNNEELRYAFSLVPVNANSMQMDWQVNKANSSTLEYTHHFSLDNQPGAIRLLSYFTNARMGNYDQAIELSQSNEVQPATPDIVQTRENGRTKYGFCVNAEQAINDNLGCFFRAGWNDGHNESWIFTEIDRTLSAGLSYNMSNYGRKDDNIGAAFVISGLSKPHREYLQDGGIGFILGDGNLNYSPEQLLEVYYSAALITNKLFLSGGYQLVINPGYNIDRGPVNVFSIRVHYQI